MLNIDRHFDVIVVGSGPGGSIAVKELTERGLDVLLLEAGRDLRDDDFTPEPHGDPAPLGLDVAVRAKAMLKGQPKQSLRSFYSPSSNKFLVNDFDNPYAVPRGLRYLWIRGRVLGGRLNTYGRVLQRMSDVDFRAASRDGFGLDWPVDYAEHGFVVRPGRGDARGVGRTGQPAASTGRQVRGHRAPERG